MPRQSQFSFTVSSAGRVPRASHSQLVTAEGATQQAPNASARALKPNAPLVTPTTCGFSLIGVSVLCRMRAPYCLAYL
jgi:hypothetical protein